MIVTHCPDVVKIPTDKTRLISHLVLGQRFQLTLYIIVVPTFGHLVVSADTAVLRNAIDSKAPGKIVVGTKSGSAATAGDRVARNAARGRLARRIHRSVVEAVGYSRGRPGATHNTADIFGTGNGSKVVAVGDRAVVDLSDDAAHSGRITVDRTVIAAIGYNSVFGYHLPDNTCRIALPSSLVRRGDVDVVVAVDDRAVQITNDTGNTTLIITRIRRDSGAVNGQILDHAATIDTTEETDGIFTRSVQPSDRMSSSVKSAEIGKRVLSAYGRPNVVYRTSEVNIRGQNHARLTVLRFAVGAENDIAEVFQLLHPFDEIWILQTAVPDERSCRMIGGFQFRVRCFRVFKVCKIVHKSFLRGGQCVISLSRRIDGVFVSKRNGVADRVDKRVYRVRGFVVALQCKRVRKVGKNSVDHRLVFVKGLGAIVNYRVDIGFGFRDQVFASRAVACLRKSVGYTLFLGLVRVKRFFVGLHSAVDRFRGFQVAVVGDERLIFGA